MSERATTAETEAAAVREKAYLGLLSSLTNPEPPQHEMELVARIASFVPSGAILRSIAERPKWYESWEVREALMSNPATPEALRRPIGTSIAVLDLLRDLDTSPAEEQAAIREDVRSLIRGLPPLDRKVVESHVRRLAAKPPRAAAGAPAATTTAAPSAGFDAVEATAAPEAAELAASVEQSTDAAAPALALAIDAFLSARQQGSTQEARALYRLIQTAGPVGLTLARRAFGDTWSRFVGSVLELALPPEVAAQRQTPAPPVAARAEPASQAPADTQDAAFEAVPEAALDAPDALEVPDAALEAVPEAALAAVPEASLDGALDAALEATPDAALDVAPEAEPAAAEAATQSADADDLVALSRSTRSAEELQRLAFHEDDRVFAAFLDNELASDEQVVALAAKVSRSRLALLARNKRWFGRGPVREAILKNPEAPEDVALQCIDHVGSIKGLASIIRDPRIRSLNVKAKAKSRLADRYRALSVDERAAAIKSSGGQLLNDLWKEAFADRQTLLKLVSDRSADAAIVMKIARSQLAPREALAAIGNNAALLSNYQLCLELALNPKTPREVLAKVVPKLNPRDRGRLRQNKGVADYVRNLAN